MVSPELENEVSGNPLHIQIFFSVLSSFSV